MNMTSLIDTSSITNNFSDKPALKLQEKIANVAKTSDFSEKKVPEEIEKVAKEFEGMVISFFFKLMFKDVGKESSLGGGYGEEIYSSMLTDEYGKAVTNAGGLGIADMVQKQLLQAQTVPLTNLEEGSKNTAVNNEIE